MQLKGFSNSCITLNEPELLRRRQANRRYLLKLDNENLLRNHKFEAGLWYYMGKPQDIHWGWESPTSPLRGHFLGHWLSAAAMVYEATGDMEIKSKADAIVAELALCQAANGGEWAGSIPEKYLKWTQKEKWGWAPQYTLHKTFMGLVDMYIFAGNEQALSIAVNWARWFYRWTEKLTNEELDNILDYETGGMLEIWAELYNITGSDEYKTLMQRYYRRRLFDPLLAGEDVLTNMHANTTIPEVLGAARAWEVTGEQKWFDIVKAYWDLAVTQRGQYCTGGQTCGEIWGPKGELSARLGDKNQEHCTVYNMMRLAEFLLRWTGDLKYADYWEQNLYNGIMAQGYWQGSLTHGHKAENPLTGLITYFLPLRSGSQKGWASETEHFYCCHGTLVQANATHTKGIYYESADGIAICQYISSELKWNKDGTPVIIRQSTDTLSGDIQTVNKTSALYPHNPNRLAVNIAVKTEKPTEFTLSLRLPWWLKGDAVVAVNGARQDIVSNPSSFVSLKRVWNDDSVHIELPKGLYVFPLPDKQDVVAFMDGPAVLVGLCDEDRIIYGDREHPEDILIPDNEREWNKWIGSYRTYNQDRGIRFIPLYDVGYERYSVYFQIKKP